MIINLILIFVGVVVIGFLLNCLDYRIMKTRYLKEKSFDLNMCCGNTSCDGVNADIKERDVSNFVLIKDIYKLPFKDKQFNNAICSHVMEHVADPVRFFNEIRRVSKNVVVLVPPLWDFMCMVDIIEHRWQFLTFRSKHENNLPKFFSLPFSKLIQDRFGQFMT